MLGSILSSTSNDLMSVMICVFDRTETYIDLTNISRRTLCGLTVFFFLVSVLFVDVDGSDKECCVMYVS